MTQVTTDDKVATNTQTSIDLSKLSVMKHLNEDWQNWIKTNFDRGVTPQQLITPMSENGLVDAVNALIKDFNLAKNIPVINIETNHIQLEDKEVSILFTCQKPYVVVIDNFLSPEECQQLIAASDNKFTNAQVVDDATGNFIEHPARTSMNTGFNRRENAIISVIERRIAELIHWPEENGEGIQVLRYKNGGEYKPHFDFFNPQETGGRKQLEKGGQRVGTFLMYLSDVEAGGATRFPTMSFEVRPKVGMALYFADVLLTGESDPLSLHSSVPVTQGVKYIATKWLRQNAYV